eukprot:GDKI01046800.1.p1 GENE.GDKI01046800.1~~GDKI01046800.1.p1  ORF type:complete len:379 (-),score=81.36 GDKI01046800.1:815-1951(-)
MLLPSFNTAAALVVFLCIHACVEITPVILLVRGIKHTALRAAHCQRTSRMRTSGVTFGNASGVEMTDTIQQSHISTHTSAHHAVSRFLLFDFTEILAEAIREEEERQARTHTGGLSLARNSRSELRVNGRVIPSGVSLRGREDTHNTLPVGMTRSDDVQPSVVGEPITPLCSESRTAKSVTGRSLCTPLAEPPPTPTQGQECVDLESDTGVVENLPVTEFVVREHKRFTALAGPGLADDKVLHDQLLHVLDGILDAALNMLASLLQGVAFPVIYATMRYYHNKDLFEAGSETDEDFNSAILFCMVQLAVFTAAAALLEYMTRTLLGGVSMFRLGVARIEQRMPLHVYQVLFCYVAAFCVLWPHHKMNLFVDGTDPFSD